ncbi:MAG TPA: hypothetical protein VFQ82_01360, partial [Stellaceae bacterium]|nr:hypothetical protein [Stellaceae bacterium]
TSCSKDHRHAGGDPTSTTLVGIDAGVISTEIAPLGVFSFRPPGHGRKTGETAKKRRAATE